MVGRASRARISAGIEAGPSDQPVTSALFLFGDGRARWPVFLRPRGGFGWRGSFGGISRGFALESVGVASHSGNCDRMLNFQRGGHIFRHHAGRLGPGRFAAAREQSEAQADYLLCFQARLPDV
jgi:hypothetical protein